MKKVVTPGEFLRDEIEDFLHDLVHMIQECKVCGGKGHEEGREDNACWCCGGQGRILDITALISDVEDLLERTQQILLTDGE